MIVYQEKLLQKDGILKTDFVKKKSLMDFLSPILYQVQLIYKWKVIFFLLYLPALQTQIVLVTFLDCFQLRERIRKTA